MTVLDLNPRLADARRRRRVAEIAPIGWNVDELIAAHIGLMLLPLSIATAINDAIGRSLWAAWPRPLIDRDLPRADGRLPG